MKVYLGTPAEVFVKFNHGEHKFIGKPVSVSKIGTTYENLDKDIFTTFDKITIDEENNLISGAFYSDEDDLGAGFVKYIWDKFGTLKTVITEKTREKLQIMEYMDYITGRPHLTTVTDFNRDIPVRSFYDESGLKYKEVLKD